MSNLNLMPKLTQQVLSNAEEIKRVEVKVDAHYAIDRVLADLGIRVVGNVETPEELPPVNDYPGTYGDAYTVGIAPPYDYYVYTRPFQGETENQWFNIGLLAIKGDQGEQGEQGPKGETGATGKSTRWYSGQGSPFITADAGDQYLDTQSGDIYQYDNNWIKTGNIKGTPGSQGPRGPQGPTGPTGAQGPEGPRGEAGYSVVIVGILSSADMLPDPGTVDRHTAYIVEDGQRWLYFITGTSLLDMMWNRVPFNAGTAVMSNDQILGTFDADSKVNAVSDKYILYGTDVNGQETTYLIDNGQPGSILLRNGDNTIAVPDPEGELEAANKQYVDNAVANAGYVPARAEGEYDYPIVYVSTAGGKNGHAKIASDGSYTAGSVPVYMAAGCLNVNTLASNPTSAVNVATLGKNLTIRSGVKLSASQASILQILQNAGYTKTEANNFVGRLRIKTNNVNSNAVTQMQGVGVGSSAQATFRELEVIINSANGNSTIIAYPWKPSIAPTIYSSVSTGTLIIAYTGLGGIYAEITPNVNQSMVM